MPGAESTTLVRQFAGSNRFETYEALIGQGEDALPAIRDGLRSKNWKVRQWSAICLDRIANEDALRDLVPLLEDPHPKVRLWAVHALACDHCKHEVQCALDVVPLLIRRIEKDVDVRVRRMAVIMLTTDYRDRRAIPVLEHLMLSESDYKLLLHAREGLERLRE